MTILDCTSYEHALESVCGILQISSETLIVELHNLDTDDLYVGLPEYSYSSFNEAIFPYLRARHSIKTTYDKSCWFHATRIFEGQDFNSGIMPLSKSIDSIWDGLFELISDNITKTEWLEFRNQMTKNELNNHYTDLYSMKIADDFHHGPYGFLIKPIITLPSPMGNWDYLGAPEIVYDICDTFKQNHDTDLLKIYLDNSKGCIVKFLSTNNKATLIGVALGYLYCEINSIKPWQECSYAYDGGGQSVPAEDIIDVEIINDWNPEN